jgi:TatD DNase family protein
MNLPFINIHSHRCTDDSAVCVSNVFPADVSGIKSGSFFSVGIHPWYISDSEFIKESMLQLKNAVARKECLAIGETGLDKIAKTDFDLQKEAFVLQAQLAEETRKPVMIHCVKAYSGILQIRQELKASVVWIFHGFNSSFEMAQQILEHGCMLSFGQMLFRDDSKAAKTFSKLSPEQYFLETDDSDYGIEEIYQQAARLTNLKIEDLKQFQINNFKRIFREVSII